MTLLITGLKGERISYLWDLKHLLLTKKCTELQKVQSSNQKPASEIHSNLVPLTDPCVAIKIKNIYNHQVLALFANTSH